MCEGISERWKHTYGTSATNFHIFSLNEDNET